MHAINNLLEGPYVTEDACKRACDHIVKELSEGAGGRVEDSSEHMHPDTGWLSIDVINVLGQGLFGIHVEGHVTSFDQFLSIGTFDALVNWNNQHWTVLRGRSLKGPWVHINSIFEGDELFNGKMETCDSSLIASLLDAIRNRCGSVSLHRVTRAYGTGHHLLEAESLRSMLPKEDELCRPCETVEFDDSTELSVVTVNVDGLGRYAMDPKRRMSAILDQVLLHRSDVLLMQEVTDTMYEEIKKRLVNWKLFKQKEQAEVYYNVTATNWPGSGVGRASSYSFPSSNNGRHYVAVRKGDWAVQLELRF